mmetsp:Transcript_36424/g.74046  ORF Transcript_36424/g.74046 Transcript_36424/m.74046 type:complete len:122 (-) Transcript_36424:702-1067(-)
MDPVSSPETSDGVKVTKRLEAPTSTIQKAESSTSSRVIAILQRPQSESPEHRDARDNREEERLDVYLRSPSLENWRRFEDGSFSAAKAWSLEDHPWKTYDDRDFYESCYAPAGAKLLSCSL